MGNLEEASLYESRVQSLIEHFPTDPFLHMTFYSGKGWIGWFSGDKNKLDQAAKGLLDYGEEKLSLRCQMVGYLLMGVRHFMDLDMGPAVECANRVINRGDPYHVQFAKLLLSMFLVHMGEFETAADYLTQVIEYSERGRTEYLRRFANMFLGTALAARGSLQEGISLVEKSNQEFIQSQRNVPNSMSESILGSIYLQILQRSGNKSFSFLLKNMGFVIKNIFFISNQAEKHLTNAIQLARQTGAKGFLGQPCLQMGVLYKLKGQGAKAKEYLLEAMEVFEECDFKVHLQRAKELLASLQ